MRIRGERADNLEQAIAHYEQALDGLYPRGLPGRLGDDPEQPGERLWRAHPRRAGGQPGAGDRALRRRRSRSIPARPSRQDWARTQNNLANAYRDRIRGERADNLEQAIAHYDAALTVYTREAFPEHWAMTQNNLANAYRERIRGERADNLEQAIEHSSGAHGLYPRGLPGGLGDDPEQPGDRLLRTASAASGRTTWSGRSSTTAQALTVYTREAFPAEYRRTQRNLGALHFGREDWARAHAAFTAAIEAGADLLAAAYTETGRRAEVGESARLYAEDAYTLLRLERPGDGLVRLEQGKTRLLSEALALAALDLTMLAEADQEAMRSARQAVRELEAEMRLPADTPARRSDRDLAEALRQARADLDRLIASIRAERPEFMPTGLDLPGLLGLIPEGGALVAPLFTSKGSAVFVLPHGTATVTKEHVIELDRFTEADLRALLRGPDDEPELGGWLGAYANEHVPTGKAGSRRSRPRPGPVGGTDRPGP